jgi:hypothetical protein
MQKALKVFALLLLVAGEAKAWDSETPWLFERKILGENNLRPVEETIGTSSYEYAQVIARVERQGDNSPFCTASRVGKNLFLTNFHCDYDCETMQFTMGVEKDKPETDRVTYACKQLVHKVEEFDYALYVAEPAGTAPEHEYPILTLSGAPVVLDQELVVASHPAGRLKEIDDSKECIISEIEPFLTDSGRTTIKHMCDTEGGSSGSPVLDRKTGHAVALHWGGRTDQYNMAIPMNLVLKNMKETVPADIFAQLSVADMAE